MKKQTVYEKQLTAAIVISFLIATAIAWVVTHLF
jgi:hypothetical protein